VDKLLEHINTAHRLPSERDHNFLLTDDSNQRFVLKIANAAESRDFLEALGIFTLAHLGTNPAAFVILSGLVFFAWGEIYSLFPSTCTDTYGWKWAAGNAGMLYTAKGTAVFLVPIATKIATSTSWQAVFLVGAAMNAAAAIMALVVLKPMRKRFMDKIAGKVPLPVAKAVAATAKEVG